MRKAAKIHLNQVGYPAKSVKIAVTTKPCTFQVIDAESRDTVLSGTAQESIFDTSAGEDTWHLDFTSLQKPGSYFLTCQLSQSETVTSPVFTIGNHVYKNLEKDLIKAFYFQRCGTALTKEYAGEYTHSVCHTAPAILLEDYINHTAQPASWDMTGGWHDAGDFGRYTTAAAVAVAHLLYAYELFPESFGDSLNIPESGNGIPDILNECLYELKWLLKMQREDGGVYHKLTSFCHADYVMPEEDKLQFLLFPVSSMAVADFAAVMALASRIYRPFLPEFADAALAAARRSWEWLLQNPYVGFHNPEGSNTGEYGDESDLDERLWASAELLRSDSGLSGSSGSYLENLTHYIHSGVSKTDFGWPDVSGLAMLCTLFDKEHHAPKEIEADFRTALFTQADTLLSVIQAGGYRLAMYPEDYSWGSNMIVCNRSMLLILAFLLAEGEKKQAYREGALEQLHYLLGKNALDVSYVTGHGEHAYRNPHNRPTFADGIELPMPGWVSGGPNKTPCDEKGIELIPADTPPMKCYVDVFESYSTNEITIYWNSPAVFMTAFFEAFPC